MNKFNLIALLHQSQLKLFIQDHNKEVEEVNLDFPEDTVKKSDIFDTVKFSFDVKNQLIKRPELKGSTILFLLPNEMVFSKAVSLRNSNLEEEKRKFFAESPYTEEESNFIVYADKSQAQLLSVPKKLITDIENSFSKIGFKVMFLPLAHLVAIGVGSKDKNLVIYELGEHFNLLLVEKKTFPAVKELDLGKEKEAGIKEEVKKIKEENSDLHAVILFNETSFIKGFLEESNIKFGVLPLKEDFYHTLLKLANLHRREVSKYLFGSQIAKSGRGLKIPYRFLGTLALLGLLFTILVPVFMVFKTFGQNQAIDNSRSIPIGSPTAQITATPSAQVSTTPVPVASVGKADLRLKVLNGNRIPGDAGRLEKKLNAVGFTNSETDTADKQDNRETTVKLSDRVNLLLKVEIQKVIEQDYRTVVFATGPATGLDIEVLTGTRK